MRAAYEPCIIPGFIQEFEDAKALCPSSTPALAWHVLYQAALFETDRSKLAQRIAEAEKAILAPAKELFIVYSDHIEEGQMADDALYDLARPAQLRIARSRRCLMTL